MIQKSLFQTAARIVQLGNAITWIRNQKTQFMGLTSTQSEAVRYILRNYEERELTAADIMENLQLSQSTVAGIIQRLQNKGLIRRTISSNDNRKNIIAPTEKGLELEAVLREKAAETEAILLNGMTDDERKEFNRLLAIALDNANAERLKGAE